MGCADIIPGVSGGTIALVLGIYERLIASIKLMDMVFVKSLFKAEFWKLLFQGLFSRNDKEETPLQKRVQATLFIGFLVLGILIAIAAAAKIITLARDNYPEATRGFFLGLVAASVKVPFSYMKRQGWKEAVSFVLFTVGTWLLLGLGTVDASDPSLLYVFICGAIAISAMILPGISGAFILLMLGLYDPILLTVKGIVYDHDFSGTVVLLVLVAGILAGIVAFSRVLYYLLRNHHDVTMAALVGLMVGSLRVLWPFKSVPADIHQRAETLRNVLPAEFDRTVGVTLGVFAVGVIIVFVLEWVGKKHSAA